MRAVTLTLLVLAAASAGCAHDLCGNTEVRRIPSPEHEVDAVLFERSCGATTDFTTQVTVVSAGEALPNEPDPVFVADRNDGQAPAARWGGPPATVEWRERDRLAIRYAVEARVFRQRTSVAVVTRTGARRTVQLVYERAL